jgi:hypothetical protein
MVMAGRDLTFIAAKRALAGWRLKRFLFVDGL